MEAYCVKCKTKRTIQDPQAVFTATGTPATSGVCPVCGTRLFRMGRTEAHAGLSAAPIAARPRNGKPVQRSGKLVIVESPAKAKTVGRFLGKGYTVKASVGHVRDLLKSQLSVDVDNNFEPKYRVPNDKRPLVKEIKELAGKAESIFLATDPDREGEAIAWHLIEAAEMEKERTQRVVFHEITDTAVTQAFEHPRPIDMHLVDAQQARRVLDRLVGYNLSPVLWRKVRSRLSAGRVQSVALRMIVDREREIEAFVPVEYWTIQAELNPQGLRETFLAKLIQVDDADADLDNEAVVTGLIPDMEKSAYRIEQIKRGTRRRSPPPPFITSTLQQDASRRLGFTAKKTMAVAQQLYEGLDLGDSSSTGLITYMRTDSPQVASLAQEQARVYIQEQYGKDYLPEIPPIYRSKARGAQEAHEAIRPTDIRREPAALKDVLSRDQQRLYALIWQRFLASQMTTAVFDTLTVDVRGKGILHSYLLRANGSTMTFAGFMAVYENGQEEESENGLTGKIPAGLEEDQVQNLKRLIPEQHFTQPPPRYSDASLVKALEENGIGRPSTYAPTISTLLNRAYVVRETKRLQPTETGVIVNDLLLQYFPNILDIGFTARMEDLLDEIADGEQDWVKPIRAFYGDFAKQVEQALQEMPEVKTEPEPIGRLCPESGHELVIRHGRFGKFISCAGFPACRYTEPWLEKIGVTCPEDGGEVVQRWTRKGRIFYGCANYPTCQFTSWKRPLKTPCPNCGGTLVALNKTEAECLRCKQRTAIESEPEN